ncbi:MAG: T9SS type A sorting domain-containing protein [Candidatus Cloacimonadota bacterium]|nr:T9SS type A sorting domain-containing protein [Candidatus Cloacimonadota bacterium]
MDWQFIADISCYDDGSGTNQRTAMVNVPASDTYDYRMASVYNPNKADFGKDHINYKEITNKSGTQSSWANLGSVALTIPITEAGTPLPSATKLQGNYPNPFNPSTTIKFQVKKDEKGVLSIFNVQGQLVERKTFLPGEYNYEWNAKDKSSGVYFYRLQTDNFKEIRKMLLLK